MYVINVTDGRTDGHTDAMRWHDRSIALAWSGKKLGYIIVRSKAWLNESINEVYCTEPCHTHTGNLTHKYKRKKSHTRM